MATVALHHQKVESHPERVSNIKPFINSYNWEGINYLSKIEEWKKCKQNNLTIVSMFCILKKIRICLHFKTNSNCKKQIILLIITINEKEGWHYLVVKNLLALSRQITSKHGSEFYCLSCLHSFATKNKLESHEK